MLVLPELLLPFRLAHSDAHHPGAGALHGLRQRARGDRGQPAGYRARAAALHAQVVGLAGARANLTRDLNLTARAKDAIMQMLLSTRRDLDGLNNSFRQCQADRVTYTIHQQYMAAIIQSEQQCQEQLKTDNKTCHDRFFVLEQKIKVLEMEMAKDKALCSREKEALALARHQVETQRSECERAQGQLAQQKQLSEERLQQVQALCAPLDRNRLETELRMVWRDSVIARALDNLNFGAGYSMYHGPGTDPVSLRRACDQLPAIMATKSEELAQRLRADIERVARENERLHAQKLEAEQRVRAGQTAAEKAQQEAAQREAKFRAECSRQTDLALEEKTALRKERDALAKELEERKQQVAQLQMQVAVKSETLSTCVKAKSQPLTPSRAVAPVPNPPPIDPVSLDEFRRKILESQRGVVLQVRG
uniref:Plasmalemma vesicle associated protein n=1 Tax=Cavia porcellus TaxID=10141 RepID=H0V8Z8_CAVPO